LKKPVEEGGGKPVLSKSFIPCPWQFDLIETCQKTQYVRPLEKRR
jgi:hypothetical protein